MAKLPQGMTKRTIKGQVYFEIRFTIDGKRYAVADKSVKNCLEKAEKKREEVKRYNERSVGFMTLDEYRESRIEAWRNSVTVARVNNEEYLYNKAAKTQADRYGTPLGKIKLQEIERKHLEKVQAELAKHYSTTTVNAILSEVNALLKAALNDQLIDRHPANGFSKLKKLDKPARDTIHRALSIEATEKFFQAAEKCHTWYLPLYEFLLNTGCRVGEAAALFPSDITKEEDGTLRVRIERTLTKGENNSPVIGQRTKTPSSKRVIHLNNAAKAAMYRQKRVNAKRFGGKLVDMNASEKPIFRSPCGCLVMTSQLHTDLKNICEKAGIERFSVHAFRDTFATRALESGMNPKTLQEILGHKHINVTMELYAHVMNETKKAEMSAVVTRQTMEA